MIANSRIDELESYLDGIMSSILQSDSSAAGKAIYLQKVKRILELKSQEFDRMKDIYQRSTSLSER